MLLRGFGFQPGISLTRSERVYAKKDEKEERNFFTIFLFLTVDDRPTEPVFVAWTTKCIVHKV